MQIDGMSDDDEKRGVIMQILPHAPERISKSIMTILINPDSKGDHSDVEIDVKHDRLTGMQGTVLLLQSLGIDPSTPNNFRKEFKIMGTIGTISKDSLNYISLCSEINDGKKKGYKDGEIAMAIRKAVCPGSNLRTYLDSKTDLTLDGMLSFIHSALKEKSSTELFQDLSNAHQLETEDSQKFVLRAMELREKVLQASQADGSIRYDESLVQAVFLRTVRTGLYDDTIKARIDPFIRKGASTSDEELIQELNLVASEEAERKLKKGMAEKRKVNINEACASIDDPLLNTVKEMSEQIKSLKKDLDELKSSKNYEKKRPFRRGCDYCSKQGKGATCRHCYRCGAGDHLMSNCKKSSSSGGMSDKKPSSNC